MPSAREELAELHAKAERLEQVITSLRSALLVRKFEQLYPDEQSEVLALLEVGPAEPIIVLGLADEVDAIEALGGDTTVAAARYRAALHRLTDEQMAVVTAIQERRR